MEVVKCGLAELPAVKSLADEVFLRSRERKGDFDVNYPSVFDPESKSVFYAVFDGPAAVSAALYKPYPYMLDNKLIKGATVGFVCTNPDYRGKGLSSAILKRIGTDLIESDIDFGVLYTGIPGFYERLGWRLADDSAFCELELTPEAKTANIIQPQTPQQVGIDWLEEVRVKHLPDRVVREKLDYRNIPLPAECVECYAIKKSGMEAYALLGRANDAGFLYEMIGDTAAFPMLWDSLTQGLKSIYLNDRIDSPSYIWLRDNCGVSWIPRFTAMYLEISDTLPSPELAGIHVHYYDHI